MPTFVNKYSINGLSLLHGSQSKKPLESEHNILGVEADVSMREDDISPQWGRFASRQRSPFVYSRVAIARSASTSAVT